MNLLIQNGFLIDPASKREGFYDLFCSEGRIKKVERRLRLGPSESDIRIEARGLIVSPGFIDLHTLLREPGYEHKETIRTGMSAAAAGGFTTLLCMANTHPVNDNAVITEFIL